MNDYPHDLLLYINTLIFVFPAMFYDGIVCFRNFQIGIYQICKMTEALSWKRSAEIRPDYGCDGITNP